ncbi:hypothetical protein LJC59_03185 [Desulfovibrio sp. OttesenSCG-928-A18]|nr:hypothetical protein [Desulfovibrio sp. OttesenSCG-928-A18]
MSVLNTMPTPVIQMTLVEKLVTNEQNHPQVQQQLAGQLALETIKQQDERVSGLENTEHGKKVREREGGGRRGRGRDGRRRGRGSKERESGNAGDDRTGPGQGDRFSASSPGAPDAEAQGHGPDAQGQEQPSGELREGPAGPGSSSNPWAGNLLNIKV